MPVTRYVNSRNRNISFGYIRSSNKFELSFNLTGGNFRTQLKPIYIHSVVLVSYLAKLTRVKRVVSKSCATIKGPSTRINGILERKYKNKKLCIKQAADIVRTNECNRTVHTAALWSEGGMKTRRFEHEISMQKYLSFKEEQL